MTLLPIEVKYPVTLAYSSKDIIQTRQTIHQLCLKLCHLKLDFDQLNNKVLTTLLKLYNTYFFHGALPEIGITINNRLSNAAGKTKYNGGKISIDISAKIFNNLLLTKDSFIVDSNLICQTRLKCLQLTVEHELIHAIMMHYKKVTVGRDKIYSSHGLLFKALQQAYFGLVNVTHNLYTQYNDTSQIANNKTLVEGQVVLFNLKNIEVQGIVLKLNPKCAILLYQDDKYNVHYSSIKIIKDETTIPGDIKTMSCDFAQRIAQAKKLKSGQKIRFVDYDLKTLRVGICNRISRGKMHITYKNRDISLNLWHFKMIYQQYVYN